MKKRITMAAAVLLLTVGIVEAGGHFGGEWEEASILYQKHEAALRENDKYRNESAFFEASGWEHTQDSYREIISESFFGEFNNGHPGRENTANRMSGILAAEEWESVDADSSFGMRIVIDEGGETREYLYYDSGDMIYIACLEKETDRGDMPEYQVCREVLDYRKLSWLDPDAESIWENQVSEYEQRIGGEITEYCIIDRTVFQIDREEKLFLDVTKQLDAYMAKWLEYEAERVFYGMKVTPEAVEKVAALLPEGYHSGNIVQEDNYVAVCDLNHDGEEDYAAVIRKKTDEYQDYHTLGEELWMFLSDGMGGYERRILVNDFYCSSLEFVADGVLRCHDWGEENPLTTDYFVYDEADEDFYISKAWQCKESMVLMESRETIGEIDIGDYYGCGVNDHGLSSGWGKEQNRIFLVGGAGVSFYDRVNYKNVDREIEQTVNEEILRVGHIFAEEAVSHFEVINDFMMGPNIEYLTPRLFSGYISGFGRLDSRRFASCLSIMMDVGSGEILDMTEVISKEDMLRICRSGMKDRWRNSLQEEEEERVLKLIEEEYENACRVTSDGEVLLSMKGRWICFSITAWGVHLRGNDEDGMINVMLDKEYFFDTPLWYYMEPIW